MFLSWERYGFSNIFSMTRRSLSLWQSSIKRISLGSISNQLAKGIMHSKFLIETSDSRIFLMKDLASVEEAEKQGAKLYLGDYELLVFR